MWQSRDCEYNSVALQAWHAAALAAPRGVPQQANGIRRTWPSSHMHECLCLCLCLSLPRCACVCSDYNCAWQVEQRGAPQRGDSAGSGGIWFGIAYAKCKNLFCVIKRKRDCAVCVCMCVACGMCATPNERHVRVRPPGRHISPAGPRSQGQSVSQANPMQLQQQQPVACGRSNRKKERQESEVSFGNPKVLYPYSFFP